MEGSFDVRTEVLYEDRENFLKAEKVIAMCGDQEYQVKSRYPQDNITRQLPCRPDSVTAYMPGGARRELHLRKPAKDGWLDGPILSVDTETKPLDSFPSPLTVCVTSMDYSKEALSKQYKSLGIVPVDLDALMHEAEKQLKASPPELFLWDSISPS